jgi:hypothetical protein
MSPTGGALPIESVIAAYVTQSIQQALGWTTNQTVVQYVTNAINVALQSINNAITVLQTQNALFEKILAPFIGGGGMIMWKKSAALIPPGWAEVVDWRGRLPLGVDPNDYLMNAPNLAGGSKQIVQTVDQMPKHEHFTTSQERAYGWGSGNGKYLSYATEIGGNANYVLSGVSSSIPAVYPTQAIGNNQPMNIMNPYRTVYFIEWVGGV